MVFIYNSSLTVVKGPIFACSGKMGPTKLEVGGKKKMRSKKGVGFLENNR